MYLEEPHNYFIDQWTKIIPKKRSGSGLPDIYAELIIDYQYLKLAKVMKIEPLRGPISRNLPRLSIDGTLGLRRRVHRAQTEITWCSTCAAARVLQYTDEAACASAGASMDELHVRAADLGLLLSWP